MKYIQLFEEFIAEDALADLMGGGEAAGKDGKAKEDPVADQKKKIKREEKAARARQYDAVQKVVDRVTALIKKHTGFPKELEDEIISALRSKDRVEIHNAVNDVIYQQQKYAQDGDEDGISDLTLIKVELDKLDKSYTNNKII
jgi:hypothetical protein